MHIWLKKILREGKVKSNFQNHNLWVSIYMGKTVLKLHNNFISFLNHTWLNYFLEVEPTVCDASNNPLEIHIIFFGKCQTDIRSKLSLYKSGYLDVRDLRLNHPIWLLFSQTEQRQHKRGRRRIWQRQKVEDISHIGCSLHRGCTIEYAHIYTFSQKGEITPEHN